jgi:hypothetical protein
MFVFANFFFLLHLLYDLLEGDILFLEEVLGSSSFHFDDAIDIEIRAVVSDFSFWNVFFSIEHRINQVLSQLFFVVQGQPDSCVTLVIIALVLRLGLCLWNAQTVNQFSSPVQVRLDLLHLPFGQLFGFRLVGEVVELPVDIHLDQFFAAFHYESALPEVMLDLTGRHLLPEKEVEVLHLLIDRTEKV